MNTTKLRLGRINYLNVWPLYELLKEDFGPDAPIEYILGHPSELNQGLLRGEVDVSPSSAFAYLSNPGDFRLLPGLSIAANQGPIQSVLLMSPVPLADLPEYLAREPRVGLSLASASSVALLKVLWKFAWKLPEPQWTDVQPGQGLALGRPFLEIGDFALRHYLKPPQGWHVVDLGTAWKEFCGENFVFAVWIVRRDLEGVRLDALEALAKALSRHALLMRRGLPEKLAQSPQRPDWLSLAELRDYFENVSYRLEPPELASLTLFADYCRQLTLIKGVPALCWQK